MYLTHTFCFDTQWLTKITKRRVYCTILLWYVCMSTAFDTLTPSFGFPRRVFIASGRYCLPSLSRPLLLRPWGYTHLYARRAGHIESCGWRGERCSADANDAPTSRGYPSSNTHNSVCWSWIFASVRASGRATRGRATIAFTKFLNASTPTALPSPLTVW